MNNKIMIVSLVLLISSCSMQQASAPEPKKNNPITKVSAIDTKKNTIIANEQNMKVAPGLTKRLLSEAELGNIKVRIVNAFEVVGASKEGEKVRNESMAEKAKLEKMLQDLQKELVAASQEFNSKFDTLSDDAKTKEEKRIAKMEDDLKIKARETKETFEQFVQKRMGDIGVAFDAAAKQYAQIEKIDLLIDETTGRPVYVAEQLKCTNQITAAMDKNYKVALTTNQDTKKVVSTAQQKNSKA
jgi:Skp family chaperone for outer membrane proteins